MALFTACTPFPVSGPDEDTRFTHGGKRFERRRVQSSAFAHEVFAKAGCDPYAVDPVPVFLDGDGSSWIRGGRVSDDPTPTDPIALDLLAVDASCGVYVSRACSFGLAAADPRCEPAHWTIDRYSDVVVRDLAEAVERVVPRERSILLVGYSGGGLLASHLASRIGRVRGLITLGANLDLAAWATHHRYTPEIVARSPRAPFPLRPDIVQLHVFGALDTTSPASLSAAVLDRDGGANVLVLEAADHTCCWTGEWPRIRRAFQHLTRSSERRRSSSPVR